MSNELARLEPSNTGGKQKKKVEFLTVRDVGVGYNCCGYVWFGTGKAQVVFDTGATRNCVDYAYVKALQEVQKTKDAVVKIEDIKPLTCAQVNPKHNFKVDQIAWIRTTFKESSTKSVTKTLGYCVVNCQHKL